MNGLYVAIECRS